MFNKKFYVSLAMLFIGLTCSQLSFAYQATGPITELTDTKIVIQKGTEKWEFKRDATTTVNGDLKVGGKVTVEYNMSATKISAKDEAAGTAKKKK